MSEITIDADRFLELERRVRALEDAEAIRNLKAEYAAFCDDQYNPDAIAALFTEDAVWQRCVVHFYRNVFSHVPRPKMREAAAMLKATHAAEDVQAAREKAWQVIAKLREQRLTKAAELVENGIEETFAYYRFPGEHCRRVRTNNPLERILREIRRRARVGGAFPDGQSALNLAAARLRHVAGTEWSTKRYLSMEFLKDLQPTPVTA
jgi:transposase-like protein